MSTFVLVHGAGDSGWAWHRVADELQALGHDAVAPDLPADDETPTLHDYATAVVEAVGDRSDLVVLGHSFGAFTATLVADRLPARLLVLLAAMVPAPGEPPGRWWENTGYARAVEEQAALDGGLTGHDDPYVAYLHDVPRPLAEEAMVRERDHPSAAAMAAPWPLAAWPDVPTRVVLCREDRFLPPALQRRVAAERLGLRPVEIDGSHCVHLSRPRAVAELLVELAAEVGPGPGPADG
ncbi:alpha/beta hydrolase [Desertihabitans brevis]|uniref:Alpha/beta hydrolase n=1 Tax=Desertihabitans brevis TaxID=2268447 RepID=A0A367YT91_9ACTN|nr:alpha/beta fold hydrolase [Desertihabitans brevis]RCK69064.1 alpha/beta hydrolase [Desertihabitans brevis]